MQRSRFFTAAPAETAARAEMGARAELATDAPGALVRLSWLPALTLLLVAGAGALIATHPNTLIWDQARLLEARFEAPWYPSPPFGFTAQLLVCLLRPFVADAAGLDSLVRIAAMTLWAGAATWLATGLIARRELQAVLLLVLFTSQYPFLWLSTELVAGGLLCLVLGAWVRGAPPWVTGSLLALSLAKGARKAGWAFQWAWLAVPLLIVLRRRCGLALDANERALLATAIGVAPFVLFAYPHIRYVARY